MVLVDAIKNAVASVDALNIEMANQIADEIERLAGPTIPKGARRIRTKAAGIVRRFYGTSIDTVMYSRIYRAIVEREMEAAIAEMLARTEELKSYTRRINGEVMLEVEASMSSHTDTLSKLWLNPNAVRSTVLAATKSGLLDPERRWVDPNGYRLSDRVWQRGNHIRRMVDRMIVDAAARGVGPVTLARDLRIYLSPEFAPVRFGRDGTIMQIPGKPRGGGAGTSLTRTLARTELQQIAHQSTILFVESIEIDGAGVKWNLSPAHPKIDVCDTIANRSSMGYPRGVYSPGSVPKIPHPNCLCGLTPWMPSRREVMRQIEARYL